MTLKLEPKECDDILKMNAEQRMRYLLNQVREYQQIWILVDQHGCVMLNSDDEDCVPVWPSEQFAESWAQGDWADCKPEAINLDYWYRKWTQGLDSDELAVAVFPDQHQDAIILWPEEFEMELKAKSKPSRSR